MSARPNLSPQEAATPLWLRLQDHLARRLDALRRQNDAPGLDATATAVIRGRIAEIRLLLGTDRSEQALTD